MRSRLLPARLVVYFVLAMCLFSGQGYGEVARLLTEVCGSGAGGVSRGRFRPLRRFGRHGRLGVEQVKELFASVCRPVATQATRGAFYRDWRVTAIDGTTFDLARHGIQCGGVQPSATLRPG
jgi:hypothetical protein